MVNTVHRLWKDSPALTATGALMFGAFFLSVAGIFIDPRMITGAPAWLKPAKFAVSTGIFCVTMAWLFRYLTIWPRLIQASGWVLATVLIIEVAIIDFQAARGTTSHFNIATAFDAALFSVMGVSIAVLWLTTAVVLVALFRQEFEDPAWGWWVRMGMLVTVLGAGSGGFMLGPTPAQAGMDRPGQRMRVVGAHTVGGPDGGPGLPGTGWSTQHGDFRPAHFLGLHGVQILPLIGWLVTRKERGRGRSGLAVIAGVSYLALVAILIWQALRGQSLVRPDGATMLAIGIWLAGSAAAIAFVRAGWYGNHILAQAR